MFTDLVVGMERGSSINGVTVLGVWGGSMILLKQSYSLNDKQGPGCQKLSKFAWRHLWTTPNPKVDQGTFVEK